MYGTDAPGGVATPGDRGYRPGMTDNTAHPYADNGTRVCARCGRPVTAPVHAP